MKTEEYKTMYDIEDNYWWYVGLRGLIISTMNRLKLKELNVRILDAGCGTGKVLAGCAEYRSYGIDFSEEAVGFCKLRGLNNIVRGSISHVPFKGFCFDLVMSLDVLYHTNVKDDVETLKEICRVMSGGGILLLNLPAYNFLRSRHDEAIHTRHRYTRRDLKERVQEAGFEIEKITYRNTFLFPIAVLKRIFEKYFTADDTASDLKPLPFMVNKLFTYLLFLENRLIMSGIDFPFGLSIYCVARKKEQES